MDQANETEQRVARAWEGGIDIFNDSKEKSSHVDRGKSGQFGRGRQLGGHLHGPVASRQRPWMDQTFTI